MQSRTERSCKIAIIETINQDYVKHQRVSISKHYHGLRDKRALRKECRTATKAIEYTTRFAARYARLVKPAVDAIVADVNRASLMSAERSIQ